MRNRVTEGDEDSGRKEKRSFERFCFDAVSTRVVQKSTTPHRGLLLITWVCKG
jgi:hypothetical protein